MEGKGVVQCLGVTVRVDPRRHAQALLEAYGASVLEALDLAPQREERQAQPEREGVARPEFSAVVGLEPACVLGRELVLFPRVEIDHDQPEVPGSSVP